MNSRTCTIKYAIVHMFFWSALCAVSGYAVVCMLNKGYSNSKIGTIIAASNILAVIFQPFIASAADKYTRLTLRKIICFFTICMSVASVGLILVKSASWIMTVCMAVGIISITVAQPFLNAISVKIEEQGISLNFGLCRSCGSVAFAAVSAILGILIEKYSVRIVPFAALILLTGLWISVMALGNVENMKGAEKTLKIQERGESKSLPAFLIEHRKFAVFLAGVVLLFYSHVFTSSYLIQIVEHVGGNSSHMGIANGIAAVLELPLMVLYVKIVRKIKCQDLLCISGVFFVFKFLGLFWAKSIGMVYFAQIFQMGSYALFIPASVHYISQLFGKEDAIKGQSMVTTAITMGTVLASLLGGRILDVCGIRITLLVVVLAAVAGVVFMALGMEKKENR